MAKKKKEIDMFVEFQEFLNMYMRMHKRDLGAPPHFTTEYLEPRFFKTKKFNEMAEAFIGKLYVDITK